jgi:hypothetical protein
MKPYQYTTIETDSPFGLRLYHSFVVQTSGSDKLMVMLPGRGYTIEQPLLYFLRLAALEKGYDVLSIQYGFQAAHVDLTGDNMAFVQEDIQAALKGGLDRPYTQVVIAGKSMGTPLAVGVAQNLPQTDKRLLLLTPVGGAAQNTGDIPSLALIGTADPMYQPNDVQDSATLKWHVYDGLNHSLEVPNDYAASLAILPEIIATCASFL